MKILLDNIDIKNPCEGCVFHNPKQPASIDYCHKSTGACDNGYKFQGQQSILSQCVEVDIDNHDLYAQITRDIEYWTGSQDSNLAAEAVIRCISQFILEQIKQEGKDHGK